MSNPYPPQQAPRRLERSTSNKLIGGVCGGVANYLNMDANLVRILTVAITLFTGVPVILYILALFLMPEERTPTPPPHVNGPQSQAPGYGAGQYGAQSAYTPPPASPNPASTPYATSPVAGDDAVWGSEGAPWEQRQATATPSTPEPSPSDSVAETAGTTAAVADRGTTDDSADEAPASAAPADSEPSVPEAEPMPESDEPRVNSDEASSWESAPAEPDENRPS